MKNKTYTKWLHVWLTFVLIHTTDCACVLTFANQAHAKLKEHVIFDTGSAYFCPEALPTKYEINLASAETSPDLGQIRANLEGYVETLRHKIMNAWHPPATAKAFNSIVSFSIHQDGTLSDFLITQSSGDPEMDILAIKTLQSLSPASPLPQGAPPYLVVDFTFSFLSKPLKPQEEEDTVTKRRKAWEENPLDPRLTFDYGRALRFAGHFQEAIDIVKQAKSLGYVGSEADIEIASSYFRLGKPNEAKDILMQCLKNYPESAQAHKLLADIFFDEKQWIEAESAYRKFVQIVPTGPLSDLAKARIEVCEHHINGDEEEE